MLGILSHLVTNTYKYKTFSVNEVNWSTPEKNCGVAVRVADWLYVKSVLGHWWIWLFEEANHLSLDERNPLMVDRHSWAIYCSKNFNTNNNVLFYFSLSVTFLGPEPTHWSNAWHSAFRKDRNAVLWCKLEVSLVHCMEMKTPIKNQNCNQAVLCLNPIESLPCLRASIPAVSTKDSLGISLVNTDLGEHVINYLSTLVLVTLGTKLTRVLNCLTTKWQIALKQRPWGTSLASRLGK